MFRDHALKQSKKSSLLAIKIGKEKKVCGWVCGCVCMCVYVCMCLYVGVYVCMCLYVGVYMCMGVGECV